MPESFPLSKLTGREMDLPIGYEHLAEELSAYAAKGLAGHNSVCISNAMSSAVENGSPEDAELEWAGQYLREGVSDCVCR